MKAAARRLDAGALESLRRVAVPGSDPRWSSVPEAAVAAVARATRLELAEAQAQALEHGLVPARYERNVGVLGTAGQARLLRSAATIVGCGGLGGNAIELLARLGLGRLRVCDPDRFDETNLNRQILSTSRTLGRDKAVEAARRVRAVNPATRVEAVVSRADRDTLARLLMGVDVVVDALDSRQARLALQEGAAAAGVPMVHAAVGGTCFQVMTVFPGDRGLLAVYGAAREPDEADRDAAGAGGDPHPRADARARTAVEAVLGTPGPTPMLAAAFQVLQVAAILTGVGPVHRNCLLIGDAASWQVWTVRL